MRELHARDIPWDSDELRLTDDELVERTDGVSEPDLDIEPEPIVASGPPSPTLPELEDDPFPATEAGDAEFFVRFVAGRRLYDHQRQRWFAFGPHHWHPDVTEQVVQAAIEVMRQRQAHALTIDDEDRRKKQLRWTIAGESEARIRHLLDLAESHPQLAIEGTEWDRDVWALGVQNGVVDLRTGTFRPGRAEDRITRVAAVPYDPDATCPRWERFILEICDDDADLAAFLQRSVGYALTGETTEQCFWVLYGHGSNGKSTLLETLTQHVIPEHSWTMSFPVHTWTESISEYQRAELAGRRLVIAKESQQAKRLKTEFIKSLTGGDTINARHPYGRPFRFVPRGKFFLACNHRPIIRDETHGMWRRVRLVPFTRTFPLDPQFADVLAAEAPGILAWAVRGCLAWQAEGLAPPANVVAATDDYRRDSDSLLRFITARCLIADYARVQAGYLWAAYDRWCQAERIPDDERIGQRMFAERMRREYQTLDGQRVTYVGVGLAEEERP